MMESNGPDKGPGVDKHSKRRTTTLACLNDLDTVVVVEDDTSYIDQLAQQLKENPSATYIPRSSVATSYPYPTKGPCGDETFNYHKTKDILVEDSSDDCSTLIDQLAEQLKGNPAATFLNHFSESALPEHPTKSNPTVVNRRRSSVSVRVDTDDETLSMSLSPQSRLHSVSNSPYITTCSETVESRTDQPHQQPNSSADEDEVFGSPMSTDDTFVSIPRSETPLAVPSTPVTFSSPLSEEKIPIVLFNETEVKQETDYNFIDVHDSDSVEIVCAYRKDDDSTTVSELTVNEGIDVVVHKPINNCPLCGVELPISCLRINVRTGDVSVRCNKCRATVIMEALYNVKR